MSTLITFDVDGTLIESAGSQSNVLHKEAFTCAFKEAFGLSTHIDVVSHHGGTDPLVLCKVLIEHHGLPKDEVMGKLEAMKGVMTRHYLQHKERAGEGLRLLPGIFELLTALKAAPNVKVGLVTGNLEEIGWAKMEALGVLELFSRPLFGGFGSDFCSGNTDEMWHDRAEMIRVASKKAGGGEMVAKFHVGDTPFDVKAAAAADFVPIGVVTGIFTEQELLTAVPETVIVQNFLDTSAALKVFGL